jgi:hypothetical protein
MYVIPILGFMFSLPKCIQLSTCNILKFPDIFSTKKYFVVLLQRYSIVSRLNTGRPELDTR